MLVAAPTSSTSAQLTLGKWNNSVNTTLSLGCSAFSRFELSALRHSHTEWQALGTGTSLALPAEVGVVGCRSVLR